MKCLKQLLKRKLFKYFHSLALNVCCLFMCWAFFYVCELANLCQFLHIGIMFTVINWEIICTKSTPDLGKLTYFKNYELILIILLYCLWYIAKIFQATTYLLMGESINDPYTSSVSSEKLFSVKFVYKYSFFSPHPFNLVFFFSVCITNI